nr:MAG TPA: PHD finger protein 1 domain, PHD finger protein [Caudoviricetes sp.]
MKLIDLLVQELPKRGGWPEGVDSIHQDHDGEIYAWTGSQAKLLFRTGIIADNCRPYGLDESIENMVTRNQYKSVFALSQKPAWNGEGVPPVGCKCECSWAGDEWRPCKILFTSNQLVVVKLKGSDIEYAYNIGDITFRQLRTEAERKRDAAVEAMQREADEGDSWIYSEYEIIYDAIAAGKIPGVKLDD